jgi:hypothetical protein
MAMRILDLLAALAGFVSAQQPAGTVALVLDIHRSNTSHEQVTLPLNAPSSTSMASVAASSTAIVSPTKTCIVTPHGWGVDDSPSILAAVERCGTDGVIKLPAPYVYTISQRMYMNLNRARLEIHGTLSFTADLNYWISNSFRVAFQNQSTAWIIEGSDVIVDGGGWAQGGIDGNGQAWMTRANGTSNQYGRPISLSIYNYTSATVSSFSIHQPQFWSFWVQDSKDVTLSNIYINGTNTDPAGKGLNYETNIDGLDTMRIDGLLVENWLFHGGDDCLAPKGNSTNMVFRNLTCIGGGIAFGSIGQYPESPDFITIVTATNITVSKDINPVTGGANVAGGAYFKSWVGVEAGVPPQGGGGGTGKVSNVSFSGLRADNVTNAVYINKCYYKVASQAAYCDTSTLLFEDLTFENVEGTVNSAVGISLNCSAAASCHGVSFKGVDLAGSSGGSANFTCVNALNVTGLQCNSIIS